MIAQLLIVASALVAAIAGPAADKYPAGLNPNLCPNYPHCDNALLAAHSQPAGYAGSYHTPASTYPGAYAGYSGHGAGAYAGYAGHGAGAYAGYAGHGAGAHAAPGYPAGVNPATCPNYPYCTHHVPTAYHAAPLPGFSHRQYPDGVNPTTCPNYPFCH